MARILVTGAAGFIGSHSVRALLARGDEVTGIDNFNDFYDPAIKEAQAQALLQNPRFRLVRGSILDPAAREACFAEHHFDGVIHLAAWAGVRPSIQRPALYQRENIEGTVALMDTLRLDSQRQGLPLPKLVFASSSSVYGCNEKVPFAETDFVDEPISPYAATKKACELLCHTYHHLYGLDVACLRFFTVYGPGQRPDLAIHKFARLMMSGQPIPRYGDGSTSRDYTYIDDVVQGVLAALDRSKGYRVYNLGNHRTVTLQELIASLAAALGVEPQIEEMQMQAGDVPRTWADISRAQQELGYQPTTPFDVGIHKFAEWYKDWHTQTVVTSESSGKAG